MADYPKFNYNDGCVKVQLDLSKYSKRHKEAQMWLGDRVLEDSRASMPIESGGLQQRSHIEDHGRKVVFPGPYGRYQYYGRVMVDSATGKGPRKIPTGPGEYILRFRKGAKLIATERPLKYKNPQAKTQWFEYEKAKNLKSWIKGVGEILGGKK